MCLKPNYIPNPWYCSGDRNAFEKKYPYWFLHDTKSLMMKVPCGVCSECLQARQNEFVQRCYMLGKYCYVLFGTLTYSPMALPSLEVNGFNLKYADIRDFQLFMHRLRKSKLLPEFRYLAVTEYGDDKVLKTGEVRKSKHRPHFHFLIFIPYLYESKDKTNYDRFKGFEYAQIVEDFIVSPCGWSRNFGDNKDCIYFSNSRFIKSVNSYTYDCHFVTGKEDNKVIYYVTKYVLKFNNYVQRLQSALRLNLTEDEYLRVWKIIRPKLLVSKGLGYKSVQGCDWPAQYVDELVDNDITEQIDFSAISEKQPMINIEGKQFPLCEYYQKKLMTMKQRVSFHNNRVEAGPFDDEYISEEVVLNDFRSDFEKKENKENSFKKIQKKLENNLY